MGNGLWKQEARDSIEEPALSNEKQEDRRFLPCAPQETSFTIRRHNWSYNPREGFDDPYNYRKRAGSPDIIDKLRLHYGSEIYRGPTPNIIFGKLGLHYYNLQKGTNLQFFTARTCDLRITSILTYDITVGEMDPIGNSSCEIETQVRHAVENIGCLSAITSLCRLKPKTPAEGGRFIGWDKDLVDGFFKGDMPEWMQEDALTGRDKLQYYEMKDSEIEEENEWLQLYTELALFSKWQSKLDALESAKPFELKKIVVRTKENVESKKKVKAENAIFYISFKTRCGLDCNCIIRKTTDGRPFHISLEVKCLM